MAARIPGYEYHYTFEKDTNLLYRDGTHVYDGQCIIFEIRTNFRLKKLDGHELWLGEEKFIQFVPTGGENIFRARTPDCRTRTLDFFVRGRLTDYWMTGSEISTFANEASAFSQIESNRYASGIPIAANICVCTVQLPGESLEDAAKRAIMADKLVPPCLSTGTMEESMPLDTIQRILGMISPKIRVKSVDHGLSLMQACGICQGEPTTGSQISILVGCGHAFHSHCLVTSLLNDLNNMTCPLCGGQG